ncbi:MAG: phosphotransferase [Actinomycetota bacterium]
MEPWTDEHWLETAHEWIHDRVDELGLMITGPIEQPHIRPWATVMRVPTGDGALWIKANAPVLAHEVAVVSVIAGRRPDCVPELLAVDLDRGWMLMGDGGLRLREIVERERSLRRWRELLPLYAELQIDLAGHADELVALGAPDRRLAALPAQYEELFDHGIEGLTESELRRLRGLAPLVAEMCDRLAGFGLPETIQHDDLHDGQIFVREGRYLFFDWGDACVSHPFFTMAVTLEGMLAWGLDDVEGSEDTGPYRDAYLEPFAGYATRRGLEEAHTIALRLGWLCRALNVHRLALALESPVREEHMEGVAIRLRLFADGLLSTR